jgi:light-harvesting complex I chlorophyll a/b binding protein 1
MTNLLSIVGGVQIIRPPTAPLQNIPIFDPIIYSPGLDISFYRESELKHGRLAMVGTILLPFLDHTYGLGINAFETLPVDFQRSVIAWMAFNEIYTMWVGWQNPLKNAFSLKPDYQPGDFTGLGKFAFWNPEDGDLMDKELNNGRLAMIGMLGMMVQELVTQQPLF